MIKPPYGREKPWHQDHAYFNHPLETRIVGVWISLSKVTPENGCMYLVPKAHLQGPIVHFMRRDWQICDKDVMELLSSKRVVAPMDPGDVLIFDSKLPHGTPKNNSNEYRWALQLHYRSVESQSCPDEERLANFGSEGKDVTC
jgi:phytanoyl-CoA hydroxylase